MIKNIKSFIKEAILRRLHIPFSKHGLPLPLLNYLPKGIPITIVDVGAHLGDFTETISKHSNIKQAILVEAIPSLAKHLKNRFNLANYSVFECALSDKAGRVDFEVNDVAATSSMLKICREMPELSGIGLGDSATINCQARTLDDVVIEVGVNNIDLLKIDVQGAEHLVLNGGKDALNRTSMVWIEVSYKPLYKEACTFFDIYKMLYDSGFILVALETAFCGPNGELLQGDALFIKKENGFEKKN